jgi:type IV fimbrial biogenesis protein FimT
MKHLQHEKSIQLLGRDQRGFTLLELMVSITVLGILLGLSVPMFRETILNNRIVAQNNEFISGLNYARSEAIKRSDTVSLCPSTDGATCAASTNWSTGWIVFADLNADGALNGAELGPTQPMQVGPATTDGITINSPTFQFIRYTASGMLLGGAAGTFSLLKTGCAGITARQIGVSVTGRVSTTKVACP